MTHRMSLGLVAAACLLLLSSAARSASQQLPPLPPPAMSSSVCPSLMPPGNTVGVDLRTPTYRVAAPAASRGAFRTGQDAATALSAIGFNNAGGPLMFNHPTGIATDGTRLMLADRFNNRVLVWTTLPDSAGDAPALVLGQPDFYTNDPGIGRDQMNWPTAIAIAPDGRVVVADGYNSRLLIWNSFPTRTAQPADLVVRHQDLNWPWGVWTDGRRLAATSTTRGRVLIWSEFPAADNAAPSYSMTGGGQMGTPRTITSDGTRFMVGDHNARGPVPDIATHVWTTFPASDRAPDFAMRDPVDARYAWLTGDFTSDGRLLMLGRYLHLWNTFPTGADTPAALTLDDFPFAGGDGADVAVAGGRVFVSMYNGNRIAVYRSIPDADRDPDFAVGAPDICTNTLDTRFLVTNPVPATNGRSLLVSSDFDRKLYVWRDIPADSGAEPDAVYTLPFAPWDNAIHGSTFALAGQSTVYVWRTLPLAGELPDVTFQNRIGSANFTRLLGVALDGTYFALADDAGFVWIWEGIPTADQEPVATLQISRPGRLQSDGANLVVNRTDPPGILVYALNRVGAGMTPDLQMENRPNAGFNLNLPMHAITGDDHLFVADTVNNRVLVWTSMASARGNPPDAILGAESLNEVTPEIGRARLFWPGGLAYDGGSLWVGEYKFSNRLVRYVRP